MVKADPKHDYYADLELPSTADTETIKKQFRLLAKQYHPDRNPGREIEVIPKFQAIQAANEILGDPTQKRSYDRERLKSNLPQPQSHHAADTYAFKKQPKPPPPPSEFPPPPKRDPNLNRPFGTARARPASSASAEKFAQFTRAAPQTWDRAKFEDAAKAETLRNLNNMRGQPQGPPPRPPPRSAPTAPKPSSTAPSPDMSFVPGVSPGFPGLSRTNSGRRGGFAPGTPGADEPPAPPSAYAYVHRSDRPPPPAAGFSYPQTFAKESMATSPPSQRTRPSMSPLRTSKSSGFEEVQRPGLSRSSSRYAGNSGERTDINGPGLTRSASVRNSPTGHRWDESGPFGGRPKSQQQGPSEVPPPRHHSSSPKERSRAQNVHFSASESSSSEDEVPRPDNRRKATPRKAQAQPLHQHRPFSESDPALTGQFSSNNYNTRVTDDKQYHYPPPDSNGTPYRRNFGDASNPVDDITQGLNNAGIRHVHRDDVPLMNQSSDGNPSEPPYATPNTNKPFSAAEWDGKFADGDNVFRPTDATSRSRSPTKQPRPKLPSRSRGAAQNQNDKDDESGPNGDTAPKTPGVRHVAGMADGLGKAAAFQAGKFSAEDWAERLRSQNKNNAPKAPPRDKPAPPKVPPKLSTVHPEVEVEEQSSSSPAETTQPEERSAGSDAMDIDDSIPQQVPPIGSENAQPISTSTEAHLPASEGVTLHDLKDTAPFKPSEVGLSDMGELGSTLPFESRAAEELNLHQPPSSGSAARHLRLPAPPHPVLPPDEMHLTQESWSKYSDKMTQYMDAWNIFNCKMIDHFRTRQEQISLAMYHNWVTAVGDGAPADDFDGLDFVGSDIGRHDLVNGDEAARTKPKKAGYATYMQWLKQDRVCRSWWEVAFEEHSKCMEDLGRVRKLVKSIRAREFGKTG